jgi:hypothetical protein
MTCDVCGAELSLGAWPWCPHGAPTLVTVPDDVPGGFWAVNGFAEPRQFFSRSAHRAALAADNMEIRAKHAGSEDTICPRWDTVDLDSAAQLVQRNRDGAHARNREKLAPITVTEGASFREKDLDVGPVQVARE